jgi:four helix bundle protein
MNRCEAFPRDEIYGLTSQLRRAAGRLELISLKAADSRSDAEIKRFLQIARGSASELEYHLLLAKDLHFLPHADFQLLDSRVLEVQRMLAALVQRLQSPVVARS